MSIPVKKGVDLSLLHPRFVKRLEAFFNDPRIKGRVRVTSGCRTYAKQKYYYDGYKARKAGFNLAANPDRRFGPKGLNGQGIWRGSWHMEQEDGYCYAVDFGLCGSGIKTWEVQNIAKSYGIHPTVASEWWHHQPRQSADWFDAPALVDGGVKEETKEPVTDWAALAKYFEALTAEIQTNPMRRKERSERVKVMQRRLGALGIDCGTPEGIFGWTTWRKVRQFQRINRLPRDGVVGAGTWAEMWGDEPLS
ncbi:hypothetical protein CMK18_08035 [Candidatus Poribacteria bacterium]|nr:hypothetical protein [Candidatus Poribacteria bacterium]